MSISNYMPSKECGYKYDKLKNVVYLVTKDHLKDIHIDNGDAFIINLDEAPLMVECISVEFSEQESLDERYKFTKTLKFTVNGYANVNSLEGGCYGIIVASDGTTFMTNVDFPAKVTFTYNLTSSKNQTEFTLTSQSNYPTLRLDANLNASSKKCKVYAEYGVESINFIEKDYVTLNDRTSVITLFGGRKFNTVEFLKNACTLQETWDGEKATDVLSFDIAFDDYKTSWQYNLLEFMDNLYAGMVKPKSDSNAFFIGFNFGLRPSYEIATTTEDGSSNKITITMREDSVHGMYTFENPRIVENGDVTWRYVENVGDYATYECIDYNIAVYLAMEEIDIHNNPTSRYMVLEGYEDQYSQLFNVVGTFQERVTFYTTKCSWFSPCKSIGNMPSLITFTGTQCKEYTFGSRCDWHFENLPNYLIFSRTSGYADTEYTLQICNTLVTDTTVTSTFDMVHGNRREEIEVQVMSGNMKLIASYQDDTTYTLACDGLDSELTYDEVKVSTIAPYTTMKEAIIGTCVNRIGSRAFSTIQSLLRVTIPETVKSIGDDAFYYVTSLANVELPSSLTTIGDEVFYYCTSLRSIVIPNNVTTMGTHVFSDCYSLSSATLSTGLSVLPPYTFRNCINLGSITIPSNYTTIGAYAFRDCTSLTSATVSSVTSFEIGAFNNCYSLQSISFPNATYIDVDSFRNCSGLTSVTIPDGVTFVGSNAFSNCSSLNAIYLLPLTPPSTYGNMFNNTNNCPIYVHCEALNAYQTSEYWRYYAKRYVSLEGNCPIKFDGSYIDGTRFQLGCDGESALTQSEVDLGGNNGMLSSAVVGSCWTVVSIGENAFANETSLTAITLPNTITRLEDCSFYGCTSLSNTNFLPSGLEFIGDNAFSGCTSIKSVIFPNSVTTLESGIFARCTSLSSITWGNSMSYVGNYNFSHCTSLSGVSFANTNITQIRGSAFLNCTNISSINWGNVTDVGDSSFIGCISLTSLTIPNRVTNLGVSAFMNCTSLANVSIGNGVTTLNTSLFNGCTSLSSITMYSGVTSIGDYTFNNCQSLENITLPERLRTIGNYAFDGCTSLETITIPSGVTSIGSYAFYGCNSLEGVWLKPLTPPTLRSRAFDETNNCPIYVPCCSLAEYQSAQVWNGYANRLVGYAYEECDVCPIKLVLTYDDSTVVTLYCDSDGTVSSADTKSDGEGYTEIVDAEVGNCVTVISDDTFGGAVSLSSVTLSSGLTTIGASAFSGCTALKEITLPNTVTQVGSSAFSGDTSLKKAILSNSLSATSSFMFAGCSSLSAITLPNSINVIGWGSFSACTSLSSVTLESGVTSIQSVAFRDCTSLTEVYVESLIPPYLGDNVFEFSVGNANYPIYVHCCALGAYQKHNKWKNYAKRLRAIETPCTPKVEATYWGNTEYEQIAKLYCNNCGSVAANESVTQDEIRNYLPNSIDGYNPYSAITNVKITGCSASIGNGAFFECTSLQYATMSNDITTIGNYAFKNCETMSGITLSNTLTRLNYQAFQGCTSLSGITLPNTLTYIGDYAFEHCANMNGAITIPNGVTYIGVAAFKNCHHITSANIPSGVTTLGESMFDDCIRLRDVSLPSTLTSIGDSAFRLCIDLTGVTIPDSVTNIGNKAFENCEKLTAITIPSGVTTIGEDAFYNCSGVTDVWLYPQVPPTLSGETTFDNLSPNGYTMHVPCLIAYSNARGWREYAGHMQEYGSGCDAALIASYTDHNIHTVMCGDLSGTTLTQNNVRSGQESFTLINNVGIGDCVTAIGNSAFMSCASLTSINIPSGVTSIGQNAFNGCTSLTNIVIPSGVTSIGYRSFYGCSNLTDITISDSSNYQYIGNQAFYNCTSLTSCTIGSGVTSIGTQAFSDCYNIAIMTINRTYPPQIQYDTFAYTNNFPIYVPCQSVNAYKTADNWRSYASRIRGIEPCEVHPMYKFTLNNMSVVSAECETTTIVSGMTSPYKTSMVKAEMYDCVNSIGYGAFEGCTGLTTVTMPSGLTNISDYAFYYCKSLTSVTIPDSVTSIGNNAFGECPSLRTCTIGSGVTSFGDNAFSWCTSLTSVTIHNGVTSIGYRAFYSCRSITSITIPNSVTSISNFAFENCSGLTSVTVEAKTPPALGNTNAFNNTNDCPIYVPSGSVNAYKTASRWSSLASRIQPIP